MTFTAQCDECGYTTQREYEADLILPVSAHQIETGHPDFTTTEEAEE